MNNTNDLYNRWLAQPDLDDAVKAELVSIAGDGDAVTDRFYRDLEFGTGGLRGVIGAGTNRMNLSNEDLPDYYRLADLCCVPTLVEEAAGLVAVEAMACGRPVLATRSGGMPEYLAGSQAVLVERGDTVTDQLAWSIRMLYEHPALCTEMGAAGAARGREFSTAHYYEEFVRIVRDVTENGGAQ